MKEVINYLKECGTFYLATTEGEQPRVRPFGAVCEFEGKLYIVTNNQKDVYRQMLKNPKVEISGMNQGTWIRITGEVQEDLRREARVAREDGGRQRAGLHLECRDERQLDGDGAAAESRHVVDERDALLPPHRLSTLSSA